MPLAQYAGAVAALVAVIGLIALAGKLAQARLPGQGATPALRLRASLALDARRRLHLVETDDGAVLILAGGAQDQMLAWPPRTGTA